MHFLSATTKYIRLAVLFSYLVNTLLLQSLVCETFNSCTRVRFRLDVREWFSASPLVCIVSSITTKRRQGFQPCFEAGIRELPFPNYHLSVHTYVRFPDIMVHIHISFSQCAQLTNLSPVPAMCPLGDLVYSPHSRLLTCNSIFLKQ